MCFMKQPCNRNGALAFIPLTWYDTGREVRHVKVKRTVKDTVFKDLFLQPENQLRLFNELHPELPDVTTDDIAFASLHPVLLDQEYNDLGMVVRDRFLILVEAQSTWSLNILLRSLLYTASTYKEYIDEKDLNLYQATPVSIPRPEIYVIYTGDQRIEKDSLSLSEEFFGGVGGSVEVTVRVICDPDGSGIISQYIFFSKVITEQVRLRGRTKEAVEETIRICREQGKLVEYLESRQKEVVSIMEELFSYEKSMARVMKGLQEEAWKNGMNKGLSEGLTKGRSEGRSEEKEKTALYLLRQHLAMATIVGATELSEERIRQIAAEHGLS